MNLLPFSLRSLLFMDLPSGESPIGAWATRIACETEENAIVLERRPNQRGRRRLGQHSGAFSKA
jgi:hypothetical protein